VTFVLGDLQSFSKISLSSCDRPLLAELYGLKVHKLKAFLKSVTYRLMYQQDCKFAARV